ncbi:hypothetical protein B4U37_04630 [Sutcliffiella horikoshii]|uniref:DUF3953 domain-containing protein n=2 Tax=Sutcliffiella horikoshii TaxID=79883 RepID=A0ABN4ZE31_9BACI|nr:hypothetical protein B4U37_04630 [Sutcliffiella horikoshii]
MKVKNKVQVLLLAMTVLATIFLIWAGLSGNNDIFPLLLTLVVTLSMGNLMLQHRNNRGFHLYRIAFGFGLFSLLLSVTYFVTG